MAFQPQSRFGPPYGERGNPINRYGMPRQRMLGPSGREQFIGAERFPPPARDFRGQFRGSRGSRFGFEHGRGRGVVSRVPGPRPERMTDVKDCHPAIYSHQESELMGKPKPNEGDPGTTLSLYDRNHSMNQMEKQSYDGTKPTVKQEEGIVVIKLDEYNCDLHFNCNETGLEGWTLHKDGFECLWGGGRATHGVKRGKVAYEVIVLEALPVQVPETERNPHVLRVGWSVDGADFQLGEDHLSYGYGGTGKISVNSRFTDYGQPFSVGDVITCCVDLDTKPYSIFYLLNGQFLGVAFKIGDELRDKALFPHITIKNMKFQVNFGGAWPRHPITPGFAMLQNVPAQDLVTAQEGPKSRQEAEVIMMVGLPSCGKTVWAEKYCKENPAKRFYMLGTNSIINKMRIFGLKRKRNYHERWDALIKQATGCLNTWFKIAEKRVHNYIIDQTNVYFTARRRKMNNFRGYRRIAVVIVNEQKVLADRSEKVLREEGKVVPASAVMEMKANFSLPEVGETFDEVKYVEVEPPRALELVKTYVDEGQAFKRGQGPSNEGQESRSKVLRFDAQRSYGETQSKRIPDRDSWNRTKQPYGDVKHHTERHNFSEADYNTRQGYNDWNRGIREPNRHPQEGSYNQWGGRQIGSDGSNNRGMGFADSGYRYESPVQNEPLDRMQGYGHNNSRGFYQEGLKPDVQKVKTESNSNYSETKRFEHRQLEPYQGRATDSNIVGETGQSSQYQGYSSGDRYIPYYSQSNDAQYSYSNQRFYGKEASQHHSGSHSNQQSQTYTQSEPQQNYPSEQSYSWDQGYQRQTFQQGVQNMQYNAEIKGQRFHSGWQAPYSSQQEYPRQQGYTGQ